MCQSCADRNRRGFRCHVSIASSTEIVVCPPCASSLGGSADTWVFAINGGEEMLQATMAALAKAGAIRTDLSSSYRIQETAYARGTAASFHRVFPNGWVNNASCFAENGVVAKFFDPPSPEAESHVPDRIIEEVSMLALVQGHPNIIGIHGLFCASVERGALWPNHSRHALLMDFCGGGCLWSAVAMGKYIFAEQHAARVVHDLLSALEHIHSRSIIHRDVRMENVLLTSGGRPVLASFGSATVKSNHAAMNRRCGAPGYVAIEVLMSMAYDETVDLFAVGVILYFLLYRKMPFDDGDMASVLRKTLRGDAKFPVRCECGLLKDSCKDFLLRLLTRQPLDRPDARQALASTWFGEVLFLDKHAHDGILDVEYSCTNSVNVGDLSSATDSSGFEDSDGAAKITSQQH